MNDYAITGWWGQDLPLSPAGDETPGRYLYDSSCYDGMGEVVHAIAGHGKLQLHRQAGRGHVCFWMGTKAQGEGIEGDYHQDIEHSYNESCGRRKLSIVPLTEDVATSDKLERRLAIARTVCQICPDGLFRSMKSRYVVDCATRRCGPCGGVSVNHSCPKGHWMRPMLNAGLLRCYDIDRSTPPDVIEKLLHRKPGDWPQFWWQWPNVQEAHRLHFDAFVQTIQPTPLRRERAIAVIGGGPYFVSAVVTLRVIQMLGCRLPLLLVHLDELTDEQRGMVEDLGVECVNVPRLIKKGVMPEARRLTGWSLKMYTALHLPYEEIMIRDADSMPYNDPTLNFEWPEYRRTGALFYPDWPAFDLEPDTWKTMGLAPMHRMCMESGQFIVNKSKWLAGIALAHEFGEHGEYLWLKKGEKSWRWWGDKENANVAQQYLAQRHGIKLEYAMPGKRWQRVDVGMIQFGLDGKPDTLHRCRDKFSLNSNKGDHGGFAVFEHTSQTAQDGKTPFYNQQWCSGYPHEAFCHEVVDSLRDVVPINAGKVRDNLWISGWQPPCNGTWLKEKGFTVILNLAREINDPDRGVRRIKSGLLDGPGNTPDEIVKAMQALEDLLAAGERVLIHCRAGHSRSCYIPTRVLSKLENRPFDEVFAEIKKVRGDRATDRLRAAYGT